MGMGLQLYFTALIGVSSALFGGISYARLTSNQQEAIAAVATNLGSWAAGQLGWEWERESPKNFTFRDVGDHRAQFIFSTDKTYDLHGVLTNITNFKEKQHCQKYEEMTRQDLFELFELIGNTSNLESQQVKKMKLAAGGARSFEATETYEFGRNGRYLLLKYSVAKTPSGNYDFLIANHGMDWTLDTVSEEEREKLLEEKLGNIKGVLVEDLPDVGRTDILNWFEFQTNPSRTFQEIENELETLRARSEKSLSIFCKVLTSGNNSPGVPAPDHLLLYHSTSNPTPGT